MDTKPNRRLLRFFDEKADRVMKKWTHYFKIYERHIGKFKSKDISLLEIGVRHGGSLEMWDNFLGDNADIYGIDINPMCKKIEGGNKKIFIGDQSDKKFMRKVKKEVGSLDVVIDDGGHKMDQQITSFEVLYEIVNEGGVYLCEDTHTSYWSSYGGGLKKTGSFVEYMKELIDEIHEWHYKDESRVSSFCRNTFCISFYDSVAVLEKKHEGKPKQKEKGEKRIELDKKEGSNTEKNLYERIKYATKRILRMAKEIKDRSEDKIRVKLYG
jgi:hypothetical protein